MEEKKNKRLIIIIVILTILLLGSIGYIVYDNFIKEDEVVENNDKNNNNQDNEQNDEEDEIQLPEEDEEVANIGRDLFERTNKHIYVADHTYILYQEKDVYYDDLSNKDRLALTYNLIPNEYKNIDASAYNANTSCYDGGFICPSEKVSRDLFEEYYYKMFGLDKEVVFEEIYILRSDYDTDNITNEIVCNLENEEFMCFPIDGGGVSMYYNYIEYNRTVRDGDDLLVYVNFLVDGCNSGKCGIYADRKFTKFIVDNIDYEDESELFDLYRDEAGLYKLTFRKDVNGNYYWYSSEIVK